MNLKLIRKGHFYFMSTAHRPTWSPAAGRGTGNGSISAGGYLTGGNPSFLNILFLGSLSMHFSAKDLPSHCKLKMRYQSRVFQLLCREVIPEVKAPGDIKTTPSKRLDCNNKT